MTFNAQKNEKITVCSDDQVWNLVKTRFPLISLNKFSYSIWSQFLAFGKKAIDRIQRNVTL